jgi:ribosomal protein L29
MDEYILTNADRLRAMSDEELAEYLSKVQGDIFRCEMRLTHQWIDWLRSPAEVKSADRSY